MGVSNDTVALEEQGADPHGSCARDYAQRSWHARCRVKFQLEMDVLFMPRDRNDAAANQGNRDKYRDNDDVRDPIPADDRTDTSPDTKSEARGSARENVGNNARDTDANPTGPEGNDRTRR